MTPEAIPGYYLADESYVMPSVVGPDGKRSAEIPFSFAIRRTIDDTLVFRSDTAKQGVTLLRRLKKTTSEDVLS